MIFKTFVVLTMLLGGVWLAVDLLAEPQPEPTDCPIDPRNELPSLPVTESERREVAGLHRHAVGLFIEGPGFGIRRLTPSYGDIVAARLPASDETGPLLRAESPPGRPTDAHFTFRQALEHPIGGPAVAQTNLFVVRYWGIRTVQLVGLAKHPEPVVYDTASVPGMIGIGEIPTREPDAFEVRALRALRSGDDLAVEGFGSGIRAMGAIYAGKQCLSCHDRPGALLGAFSFTLERLPASDPNRP